MSSTEEKSNNADSSSPTVVATSSSTTTKVKVHFVPVGSAPMMKKTKFQLGSEEKFAAVQNRLRKMLRCQPGDSLFLYLSSSFCPGPDQLMGDLEDLFAIRGELIIHYSIQEAWG